MSALDPANTTMGDLVLSALKMAGVIGVGQTPSAEDSNDTWAMCQWMLEEWQRKRWLVYALTTLNVVSTGALAYSLGPAGDLNTGAGTIRPDKIESAFLRQLTQSQPNQVDYPLEILQAKEDYNKIALKTLASFPTCVFYDPQWPLGQLYAWPVPQASIYGLYVTVKTPMPYRFATLATVFVIPYEYYNAIIMNLAIRLRARYTIPSFAGDPLPGLAKDSLNAIRGGNTAIARLSVAHLSRGGLYNIYSDRFY